MDDHVVAGDRKIIGKDEFFCLTIVHCVADSGIQGKRCAADGVVIQLDYVVLHIADIRSAGFPSNSCAVDLVVVPERGIVSSQGALMRCNLLDDIVLDLHLLNSCYCYIINVDLAVVL